MTGIHLGQISRYERGINLPEPRRPYVCAARCASRPTFLLGKRAKEASIEIENLHLIERFRRLAEMDHDQRETAIKLIDALVAQTRGPKDRRRACLLTIAYKNKTESAALRLLERPPVKTDDLLDP